MKQIGYYNGEIGPIEDVKVPMLDRALYFADGCYDASMLKMEPFTTKMLILIASGIQHVF